MHTIRIVILLLILPIIVLAGNTGKIAGKIADSESGEPIIGANVMLLNTTMGAITDAEGSFFIIGIPPGKYEVQISYMGYNRIVITDVLVQVDLTTWLNTKLQSRAIEIGTITVVAERNMVQKDITSTRKIATQEDMKNTPGIESVTDIFKMHAGAAIDQLPTRLSLGDGNQLQVQDESVKNIHVRGGRGGEILYMVDGMPVTHPIYGGREVLDLNVDDIDQIELLTGAFNAEYGQAQSGVVNITTRSGSDKFEGGVEAKQDFSAPFLRSENTQYTSFYSGGPVLRSQKRLGKMNYFLSGNLRRANGAFDLGRHQDNLTLAHLIKIPARQDNTQNLNGKLDWDFTTQSKLIMSYHGSWKNWTLLGSDYKWLFKYVPDNTAQYYRNTQSWNLRFNRVLSKSSFFNANLGYLSVAYNASLDGTSSPTSFWHIVPNSSGADSIYTTAIPPQVDPATNFYNDKGVEAIWRDDRTRTVTGKAELVSQIHRDHIIKTGSSVQYNDLSYVDIQDGAYKLSNYGEWKYRNGEYSDPPPGPYPEFGQNRWVFHSFPLVGDWYLQDKFEKESLILNVGLRLDWLYLGRQINNPLYKSKWQAATGIKPDWNLFKYTFSPRFGISFPISDLSVLYFSYGHFNQIPELQYFYRDPWSGGLTGNPHIGFEKTILYEFGFTYQFSTNWAIDIKSYGKDISDQVGTASLKSASGIPVQLYVNDNYGRARGMEIELEKRYSHFTSFNISYALQWTNGYASSAYSDYILELYNLPKPIRERPLDWDIRHQIMLTASLVSNPGKHLHLFGFTLPDNWNITLLTRFSTGLPYTPGTTDPLEARVRENNEHMPSTMMTDLKINKSFPLWFGSFSLYLDVYNLFNRRNALSINNWTGQPFKYGDVRGGEKEIISWREAYATMSPGWYTMPRYAQLGISFSF
jgi:outer membrane receptor protein involved in Fe transport